MTSLDERLRELDRALELGRDRLHEDERSRLREVRHHADERAARGDAAVVVGLGGGTGSGKSSLFNALVGEDLADVGVRRPVTTTARAAAVGDAAATSPLMDWLGVTTRHHLDGATLPEQLVLIDLPDHDSVEVSHRQVVDRFVERVDVLVWVVDPLKYAQRALHQGYLRELATHADVTVVVLNRSDELDEAGLAAVREDLRQLLDAEGLAAARLLVTSARTGTGVDDLRSVIAGEVRSRRAIAARVAADVVRASADVAASLRPLPPAPDADRAGLVGATADALGLGGVGEDARRAYVQDATVATRPLVSGWLLGLLTLLVRPLRRWRTERARKRTVALTSRGAELPVAVRHAVHVLVGEGVEVAPRWRARLRSTGERGADRLVVVLGRQLERIELTPRPRRWWPVWSAAWTLVELVALAGGGWLFVSGVLVWLQLPPLPSPRGVGAVPLPSVLLLGGATAWAVASLLRRSSVRRGAARHARRTDRQVHARLVDTIAAELVAPLETEVDAIHDLVGALEAAAR